MLPMYADRHVIGGDYVPRVVLGPTPRIKAAMPPSSRIIVENALRVDE